MPKDTTSDKLNEKETCIRCKITTTKEYMVNSLCNERLCVWCEVEIYYLGNI